MKHEQTLRMRFNGSVREAFELGKFLTAAKTTEGENAINRFRIIPMNGSGIQVHAKTYDLAKAAALAGSYGTRLEGFEIEPS